MYIQIHIANEFCETYMPFLLFRDCIFSILSKYYANNSHVHIEYIKNVEEIKHDKDTIVLLNMYDLTLYDNKERIIDVLENMNTFFLIVNTEHWETRGAKNILTKLENEKRENTVVIEYNIINYRNILESYPNVQMLFLPLLYNEYMEEYYGRYTDNVTICWDQKPIDILFYGGLNDRRRCILEQLQQKYRVHIVDSHHGVSNIELCKLISQSKVVINILYYDFNVIFDYYRNTFLLSNDALLVTEIPREMDKTVEYWLDELEENMIVSTYDNLVTTVDKCLKQNEEQVRMRIEKQRKWFSNFNMADIIVPFFEYFLIQNKFCTI